MCVLNMNFTVKIKIKPFNGYMVALWGHSHPIQVHEELLENIKQWPSAKQAYGLVGM